MIQSSLPHGRTRFWFEELRLLPRGCAFVFARDGRRASVICHRGAGAQLSFEFPHTLDETGEPLEDPADEAELLAQAAEFAKLLDSGESWRTFRRRAR